MGAHSSLPLLHVEGDDDVSVISALLSRHGIDTKRGSEFLFVRAHRSVEALLQIIPDAIRAATDRPVGFVLDIDVEIANRWSAVCGKLVEVGIAPSPICPPSGFLGQHPDYPHRFGVWLMPDCATDNLKMEDLCSTLVANDHPLWPYARATVAEAAKVIDEANGKIAEKEKRWKRYRDVDRIKAEIYTWLSWQMRPGSPLGTAINAEILAHDSPQALAFLRWLKDLFGLSQMTTV